MSHGWLTDDIIRDYLAPYCTDCSIMPVQEKACEVTQMHTYSRTHTHPHTCAYACLVYCICLCLYVHAFSHVLPVILSCNNGEHRKVSGQVDESPCWLSPSLSSPSNHLAGRNCFGEGGGSFPTPLCLPLSPSRSLLYHGQTGKEGGREMRHRCIRFVKACLVRLVSHIWIAQFRGLAVASSAEAVWAYKRQARGLEFAGSVPLHCVYTICTHKNIGSICICFEWGEMFWQDHR